MSNYSEFSAAGDDGGGGGDNQNSYGSLFIHYQEPHNSKFVIC